MTYIQTNSHVDTVELEIDSLRSPSPSLRSLDCDLVAELTRSIEGTGLLQPIVVRECEYGFEVVFGNHRLEACKHVGMKNIRALVMRFTEEEAFLARVSENLLRNSLVNPIGEAEGYKHLLSSGWTINRIASKIGKSDSYICERLGLIDRLHRSIREKVSNGNRHLTPTHLELLSKVKDPVEQLRLADLVEKRRLGVRALEDMVNGMPGPQTIIPGDYLGECAVRIPREFTKAVGIVVGQPVRIRVRGRKLILESVKAKDRKTISGHPPHKSQQRMLSTIQNLRA